MFEIPHDIEQEISTSGADLNGEAREAFLVELYRRHRISQHQLGMALALDDYDTDGVLKRHGIELEISAEEQQSEAASLGGSETLVIVVADTEPLNYLVILESIHVLPAIFAEVINIDQKIAELRKTTFRASDTLYQSVLDRVREHSCR